MKIAIVSLGCPKNQVDADRFCHALLKAGHETVPETRLADLVVINTCGFIDSAKQEAIDTILQTAKLKADNPQLKIVVTGCLAERYREEITRELPEVDAVVGIGQNGDLPAIIAKVATQAEDAPALALFGPKSALPLEGGRIISTPGHYAYLKIAEGCSNACSYCAIPQIRGPLRSRRQEDVLEEARWLAGQGAKELVLVAQDVTAYGNDVGKKWLPGLLRQLNAIDGLGWIRMLYAYPDKIDDELLDAVAECPKVLPYFDLPVQHCNEAILAFMRRRGGAVAVRGAAQKIRSRLPYATLRTTLIVGYPGETEAQFEELCGFVKEMQFDRLGCYAFSPEEGTAAEKLAGQLPEEEKQRRADAVMTLQSRIMLEKQEAMLGRQLTVLCDGLDETGRLWLCRGAADAPEIDLNVLIPAEAPMQPGGFYQVEINGLDGFDLEARYFSPTEEMP